MKPKITMRRHRDGSFTMKATGGADLRGVVEALAGKKFPTAAPDAKPAPAPCKKPHHITHRKACERCDGHGSVRSKRHGEDVCPNLCDEGRVECDEAECDAGCAHIPCTCDSEVAP